MHIIMHSRCLNEVQISFSNIMSKMYLLINATETSSYFGAGNMDLQPVNDDVAAVMCVYSYVTKVEKAMGKL